MSFFRQSQGKYLPARIRHHLHDSVQLHHRRSHRHSLRHWNRLQKHCTQKSCRHRCFRLIPEIYRMRALSWIVQKAAADRLRLLLQHRMHEGFTFILNIIFRPRKTQTQEDYGTRTGCRAGAKTSSVRKRTKRSTGGLWDYDAVRCARLCRIPRYF